MKIIAINGKSRSGKDTFADLLVSQNQFLKIGISDYFKRFVYESFDFTYEQIFGSSEQRNTPNKNGSVSRDFLKSIGNAVRSVEESAHVNKCISIIKSLYENKSMEYTQKHGCWTDDACCFDNDKFVVPDARFVSDLKELRKAGAFLLRIKRPSLNLTNPIYSDVSETEMDSISDSYFDYVINNDSSLQDFLSQKDVLLAKVEKFYEKL